jgi:hypothetical protein
MNLTPDGFQWHYVAQDSETAGFRPAWDCQLGQVFANKMAPESASAHWPLILEVKCHLVDVHAGMKSMLIDAFLGLREVDHIVNAFKEHCIHLQEP